MSATGELVTRAAVHAGVLVLEIRHRGTDDGAQRLVASVAHVTADEWPWPTDLQAEASSLEAAQATEASH